ncbi:prevent-host-death protein [Couchioplanes caeruleus subsp. caeruleus]|uniref:Prevent-host-death protein n=2 Tax=Couchioplanes caeruleus TaxID=56438 RepID=A0A1K0FFE1_9ACTN|nr:prevent-host-death protein [Couchioplanes caeruleus subsp. caeruleus]
MAIVVQGIIEVQKLLHQPPVIVGGVAVLSRLSNPYRATVDLDVVDRLHGDVPHLEILRSADGAEPAPPAAVLLPTPYGPVKVDVLEVRQIELDLPSTDPGDRLHASAHAWANDTATNMTLQVSRSNGEHLEVATLVAEPGPLVAMKIQAVMNRSTAKQGTDLLDTVRIMLDSATRPAALEQISTVDSSVANDIALHIDYWLVRRRAQALRLIKSVGGIDITSDDVDLISELILDACNRR